MAYVSVFILYTSPPSIITGVCVGVEDIDDVAVIDCVGAVVIEIEAVAVVVALCEALNVPFGVKVGVTDLLGERVAVADGVGGVTASARRKVVEPPVKLSCK